jgi:hypothetical protein
MSQMTKLKNQTFYYQPAASVKHEHNLHYRCITKIHKNSAIAKDLPVVWGDYAPYGQNGSKRSGYSLHSIDDAYNG